MYLYLSPTYKNKMHCIVISVIIYEKHFVLQFCMKGNTYLRGWFIWHRFFCCPDLCTDRIRTRQMHSLKLLDRLYSIPGIQWMLSSIVPYCTVTTCIIYTGAPSPRYCQHNVLCCVKWLMLTSTAAVPFRVPVVQCSSYSEKEPTLLLNLCRTHLNAWLNSHAACVKE